VLNLVHQSNHVNTCGPPGCVMRPWTTSVSYGYTKKLHNSGG